MLTCLCKQIYQFLKNKNSDVKRKRGPGRNIGAPAVAYVGQTRPKGKHKITGYAIFRKEWKVEIRRGVRQLLERQRSDYGKLSKWRIVTSSLWKALGAAGQAPYKKEAKAREAAASAEQPTTAENFKE